MLYHPQPPPNLSRLCGVPRYHRLGRVSNGDGLTQASTPPKRNFTQQQIDQQRNAVDLRTNHTPPSSDAHTMDLPMCFSA
jgi:hypothetical protein